MTDNVRIFKFRSDSDPTTLYETRLFPDGGVSCECRGWKNHSKCWHTALAREGRASNYEYLGKLPLLKRLDVRAALAEGDTETAIEIVFEVYPSLTRDEAVDLVDEVSNDSRDDDEPDHALPQ